MLVSVGVKHIQHKITAVLVQKCLGAFAAPEQLSPANEWFCNKCKQHVQASKKLSVYRLPRVFLVSLKRFSAGAFHGFQSWKNACPVLVDVDPLDFTPVLSPIVSILVFIVSLESQCKVPLHS